MKTLKDKEFFVVQFCLNVYCITYINTNYQTRPIEYPSYKKMKTLKECVYIRVLQKSLNHKQIKLSNGLTSVN